MTQNLKVLTISHFFCLLQESESVICDFGDDFIGASRANLPRFMETVGKFNKDNEYDVKILLEPIHESYYKLRVVGDTEKALSQKQTDLLISIFLTPFSAHVWSKGEFIEYLKDEKLYPQAQ